MIVSADGHHLRCVTQADHARLAAAVMEAWRGDGFAGRATRAATLLAIARHDDGWEEEDASPTMNPATGRPFDYASLPHDRRARVWAEGTARLARRSVYGAALVAQHGAALARAFSRDRAGAALAERLEAERDRWYTAAPVSGEDVPLDGRLYFLSDYAMLAMGDLVSLMACGGARPTASRDGYDLRLTADGHVEISPDPFDGRTLRLSVPARVVPVAASASDAALASAFRAAPLVDLPVTIAGRPPDPS